MNAARICLFAMMICTLFSATAAAETLGALQVEVSGGVDASVRQSVEQAIARAGSSGKWSWLDERAMRAKMPSGTSGCFTSDCLTRVGKASGADAGVRVRFSGQSEIYDWTVDIYDLHNGKLAASKKGACELCGAAEVKSEFEATARAAVASTKVSRTRAPVATHSNTNKTPPPDEKPDEELPPLNQAEAEPADQTPPADDPTAGLVMVEISVTPPDATISIGDQEIGQGDVSVSLEHGSYEIKFAREGYGGLKENLVIGPQTSQKALLRVHLAKTDPDPVMVSSEGAFDRLGQQRRTYGIIGLATGGVLLGTGLWLNYLDGRPTCNDPNDNCPRLYETTTGAFLTTLAGGVLVSGGAVLLLWDVLAGESDEQHATRVVPMVGGNGVGIGLVGRF